jgi:predicted RNase H-like nuclease (RuvC/YqgF family)
MSSPLSFLVEHEDTILTAYRENNAKPKNAWISLERDLPELSQAMTFNTFKQYVSVFAFVKTELDKVRQIEVTQELSNLKNEKNELEEKLRRMARKLDKVRQNRDEILKKLQASLKELDKVRHMKKPGPRVIQKLDKNPKRISGWSVQHSKDGYYRCYRKIGKRVHSVYLGKELNVKAAEDRIRAKEKSLGLF